VKHDPVDVPEGAIVVPDMNMDDPYPYKMNDIAALLGMHRVTLLRMFQSGRIKSITPKWRKRPNPHRVFSAEDYAAIKKEFDALSPQDREYVDEVIEVETSE
jgi:hypothetical protein